MKDLVLVKLDRCRALLAECRTVKDARNLAALADAARVYAQRVGASLQVVNRAVEYKIRAQRRLGELLDGSPKHPGGRPGETPNARLGVKKLSDLGIGYMTSSRAQRLASIPKALFERRVAEAAQSEVEEMTTAAILTLERDHHKEQVARRIERDSIEALPSGQYAVIVADPPWAYTKRAEDKTHRGRCPYPSMTLDEIAALPVRAMGMADSILWLWTTNAMMRDAFEVLDAWGYVEKTILTWVKSRMGLGDWLRGKTEHCILAVRGKPVVRLTNQTTALLADSGAHSAKPDEFYALVEALCPGTRLELFARRKREGWTAWGAEVQ